jgi:hypothetical protein
LEWASLKAMIIERAVRPNGQLPRHLEATKRRGVVALAVCCGVTREPQLMKKVQHIGRVVSISAQTLPNGNQGDNRIVGEVPFALRPLQSFRTQPPWWRYPLQLVGASQLVARFWRSPACESLFSLSPSFTPISLSGSTDCPGVVSTSS